MHSDQERKLPAQLDGQTSINDLLAPIAAIVPVELREPTDAELRTLLGTDPDHSRP